MIANARMYAVAAPVAQAWRDLFAYVGERAGVAWTYIEHAAPAPVSELWARPDCGCVFMCGFPYVSAGSRHRLLAAPVPSLPRHGGRPVYFTEFIVRDDAAFATLEQAVGGRLACMLPESNSGYNAPRHYLMTKATAGTGIAVPADLGAHANAAPGDRRRDWRRGGGRRGGQLFARPAAPARARVDGQGA
ncbi:phosphate/phosphite/phosphonate ABC transporter substrate-binding protein [Cupriavidus basilensis]